MSDLLDIQEKLQDTTAALARLEAEMVRQPKQLSLSWDHKSLTKRQAKLEADLFVATAAVGREVCSYRMLPEQERVKVAGLASVIGEYQSVVTIFYDAIKNGAKAKATVRA